MHDEDEEVERVRTGVMTAGVKRVRTKKRNRRPGTAKNCRYWGRRRERGRGRLVTVCPRQPEIAVQRSGGQAGAAKISTHTHTPKYLSIKRDTWEAVPCRHSPVFSERMATTLNFLSTCLQVLLLFVKVQTKYQQTNFAIESNNKPGLCRYFTVKEIV